MAPNKEINGPLEIVIKTRNNKERDQLGSEIHNLSKTQLKVVPVKESADEAGRESYR